MVKRLDFGVRLFGFKFYLIIFLLCNGGKLFNRFGLFFCLWMWDGREDIIS